MKKISDNEWETPFPTSPEKIWKMLAVYKLTGKLYWSPPENSTVLYLKGRSSDYLLLAYSENGQKLAKLPVTDADAAPWYTKIFLDETAVLDDKDAIKTDLPEHCFCNCRNLKEIHAGIFDEKFFHPMNEEKIIEQFKTEKHWFLNVPCGCNDIFSMMKSADDDIKTIIESLQISFTKHMGLAPMKYRICIDEKDEKNQDPSPGELRDVLGCYISKIDEVHLYAKNIRDFANEVGLKLHEVVIYVLAHECFHRMHHYMTWGGNDLLLKPHDEHIDLICETLAEYFAVTCMYKMSFRQACFTLKTFREQEKDHNLNTNPYYGAVVLMNCSAPEETFNQLFNDSVQAHADFKAIADRIRNLK